MVKLKEKLLAQLDLLQEILVDCFAGGGGTSTGLEFAFGRPVDIAINHDPDAIAMHTINHPYTEHYQEDILGIDPVKVVRGRKVGLAWFSPDCKHFSKAKGNKPVDKSIRALAWIVLRWAAKVRPRVIMLENVEEFLTWGPVRKGRPIKSRQGETFRQWKSQLEALGYVIEYRIISACDFGAPTIRTRFYLIARCDGQPITWPEPTHARPDSLEVKAGKLKPYRSAAECIDWSIPCPSIFDTKEEIKAKYGINAKRPLAENTLKRIARGIQKFVLDNPKPFLVQVNHSGSDHHYCRNIEDPIATITSKHGMGLITPVMSAIGQTGFADDRSYSINEPVRTIVSKAEQVLITPYLAVNNTRHSGGSVEHPVHTITTGGHHALIAPTLIQYHSETKNGEARAQMMDKPILTIDASPRYALVSAFISKYFDGGYKGAGADLNVPLPTVTAVDHNSLVTAFISRQFGTSTGHSLTDPLATTTTVNKTNLVKAFLIKYYGQGTGQNLHEPLDTITSHDRFGIVTIQGIDYEIVDIGMRMLEPRELARGQGFPEDYVIDFEYNGKSYPKAAQVARIGNSVCPPVPCALAKANLPEYCSGEITTMEQLERLVAI